MNSWLKIDRFRLFLGGHCILCSAKTSLKDSSIRDLCVACAQDLKSHGVITTSLVLRDLGATAWAAYQYQYPLANVLHAAKYRDQYGYTLVLAELFYQRVLADSLTLPDAILPVPLHIDRLKQRGFNQALLIAELVAKRFALPVLHSAIRSKATAQQAGMKLDERKRNMRNAFGIVENIPYERVAIIDDVVTTGSTVGELAKVLHKHGVADVDVWALAYTLPTND